MKEGQEYALLKEMSGGGVPEAPGRNSSQWQSLTGDASGEWHYTGLERGTTYYVYTRRAETASNEVSEAVASDPVTTESFLYMGEITLANESDLNTQPAGISSMLEIPSTLNGNLTVDSVEVKDETGATVTKFTAVEPLSGFVQTGTGAINPNVYEKGSEWSNGHFATTLKLYRGEASYAELESGGRTAFSPGDKMELRVYRANAVTEGGTYRWEVTLRDDSGTESLLKAEVKIITQLQATVPVGINLRIDGREILQTTNSASLKNGNGMPVKVYLDEKTGKGTEGIPELLGPLTKDHGEINEPGAVYMKVSVDGSDYTRPETGVWLDTTRTDSSLKLLEQLGASSGTGYYVSGIMTRAGDVSWPWPDGGDHTIAQAYQLKFVYEISESDCPVYTPEAVSP